MRKMRLVFAFVLLMLVYGGSSCQEPTITGHTVGLIKFIRPDVVTRYQGQETAVFEDTRFLPETEIEVSQGAGSTLIFDSGVKVAADSGSRIRANSADEIILLKGRVFIDADEKEEMAVNVGEGKLTVIASAVSIELVEGRVTAYTYRGELTYNFPAGSGVLRAGESLTLKGNEVDIKPEELWSDWTGGMAEAGPRAMETPTSIGQIYARLPGAQGVARWPLLIRRHEVRVTIKGDLAVTETMQEFFNPSSEVVEGIYRLRIPEGAMFQRFAVDRNGKLVDGVIRERATATQEYQSHVYQGSTSDPALLEWVAPGSFRARIYPIKPGQVRVIAYRYSQWLDPSGKDGNVRTYVYPVGNETIAPKIGEFYFVADVSDAGTGTIQAGAGARIERERVVFAQSDFRPRSDFYIQLMDVQENLEEDEILMVKADYKGMFEKLKGARPESYAWTQFVLRGEQFDLKPEKNLRISVAMDMSAATGQHLVDLAMTFVESLLGRLREGDRVAVFAGDVDVKIVGRKDKKLSGMSEEVKESIMDGIARHSIGGATDIGKLIMEAADLSAKEPGGVVVYLGDGFPTVGELDIGALKERLGRLPNNVRLYGIALGDEANLDLLSGLCAGRGMAGRIEDRVEAAETALDLLAGASTPVMENVKYEIDGGIERVYPAEITTLKITEPLRLIGKLTGEKDPEKVTVRGSIDGKPFTKEYRVRLEDMDDLGDLRLRWAEQRLLKLLSEQEGPESVIELGTRFGIITPYTSFYVPPEEEAYNLPGSPTFEIFDLMEGAQSSRGPGGGETTLAQALFGIFLPCGCCRSCGEMGTSGDEEPASEWAAGQKQQKLDDDRGGQKAVYKVEEGQMRYKEKNKEESKYGLKETADTPVAGKDRLKDEAGSQPITATGVTLRASSEESEGTIGLGGFGTTGDGGGAGKSYVKTAPKKPLKDAAAPVDLTAALGAGAAKPGEETYTKTTIYFEQEIYISSQGPVNLSANVKKCTEASLMPIEDKKMLWRERLGAGPSMSHIVQVFKQAKKNCEIKTAGDRRAYARVVLALLGSVHARCRFYKKMKQYPALAGYIKGKILSSLSTPGALKIAMQECDAAIFLSEAKVDKMLSKIKDRDGKIVVLKKLIKLYPNDLKLKLLLLDMLEDAGRKDEAVRFAGVMREDPYATDEVRTRVGEFFIRIGDREEGKRVMSEIVEFSPWSYTSRRRLGDLYRAYGWYEDAYRQYETLSQMEPNDDMVLILLAEAAILAGRSDEGLRILEQVSQSEPSFEGKISPAEVARIIGSLKLAEMRVKARSGGEKKKLKKLIDRTRKAGILRDATRLKVVLKWDHPDAGFNLTVKFPGSELSKPFKSAPSIGLRWLTEKSKAGEDILLQVERNPGSVIKESKATLYILIDEGKDTESIEVVEVVLTKKDETKRAWALSPGGKISEAGIDKSEVL